MGCLSFVFFSHPPSFSRALHFIIFISFEFYNPNYILRFLDFKIRNVSFSLSSPPLEFTSLLKKKTHYGFYNQEWDFSYFIIQNTETQRKKVIARAHTYKHVSYN